MFLETIHGEGFLILEENASGNSEWLFDLASIQSEIMVSEESVDLLQRKIQQIPQELKETLKVASLVGYRFAETIVSEVASIVILEKLGKIYSDRLLSKAVEFGFIEVASIHGSDGVTYNFTHDKIQSAFQSMLNDCEAECLHLHIGEAFLSKGVDSLSMYCAAVQLDCVAGYLCTSEKRLILARINLEASKYCSEKSAFAKAAAMLRRGLEVLGAERWLSESFDLAFQLTETLAKAEFVVGNFDASRAAAREALQRSTSVGMMINSLVIDLELKMAIHDKQIYSTAAQALRTLKVARMPRKVSSHHVVLKFLGLKRRLGRRTDAEILNLPIMDNEHVLAAVLILSHVSVHGFFQFEENMSAYTALLAGELTLDYGLSPSSAIAFVFLGIMEMSMNNPEGGRRFEGLALKVIDRMKGEQKQQATCPTSLMALSCLSHYRQPFNQLSNRLLRVSSFGIEIGDVVYGCVAFTQTLGMMFCQGKHLNHLDVLMRPKYDLFCNLGQQDQLLWMLPTMQLVVNLTSTEGDDAHSLTDLSGEFMNEGVYMAKIRKTGHRLLIALGHMLKAIVCSYFGRFDIAQLHYKQMSKSGEIPHISYSAPCQDFFGAIAYIETYRSSGDRRLLWGLRKFKKRLERSENAGNPNVIPLATAVRSLELSLRNNVEADVLSQSFAQATAILRACGLVHIEGLLNQRAGFIFAARGCRVEAVHHFDQALEIFHVDWGAVAVYHWLQRTCSDALDRFPQLNWATGKQLLVGEVIECDSVLTPE